MSLSRREKWVNKKRVQNMQIFKVKRKVTKNCLVEAKFTVKYYLTNVYKPIYSVLYTGDFLMNERSETGKSR